jgi:hypothetical protein
MKEEGAPKSYPIDSIVNVLGEDEDFDKFVKELCDKIDEAKTEREDTLEPLWEDCEQNYWANGGPESPRESDLDFTITFETCKQASSNLSNPVFAQDQVYTAKARPGFPTIAATHDIMLDWIADQSDYETLVPDILRHAQIYTKAVIKCPWIVKTRNVRYWERDAEDEPYEDETEHVYKEGSFPYVVDPRRIYHPLPCADIDDSPWFAEEFDITPAEIKKKMDEGVYRADLNPYAIGDTSANPQEDKKNEELYIANALEGQEARTEFSKLKLMETYTTYKGKECVIIVDLGRRTWVAAHAPFYQEFPRCYTTFSWHQVNGSIDGKSLCGVTDQLHRAYVACFNILLDAGVRSIEPLVLALKELKLSERMENGRLGPGLQEVEKLVMEKLSDGIHEIRLTTGDVAFLLEMMARIEKHMRDASSIPPMFYGEEVAERPTATGTTAVLEKAMQPLYELMTRFRKTLIRIVEMQYSQYRQFHPKSLRVFIDSQSPEESNMLQAMLVEFPPGYWRDQVILETKVNSQTMSKAVKKQEALAMVDKFPEIAKTLLDLGDAAVSGQPIAPMAGNYLDVFDLVLGEWLTEFELPEVRDALDIQGAKAAGQSIAEMWQKLQGIIQQQQQIIVDLQSEVIDRGGEERQEAGASGEQGGPGSAQAA